MALTLRLPVIITRPERNQLRAMVRVAAVVWVVNAVLVGLVAIVRDVDPSSDTMATQDGATHELALNVDVGDASSPSDADDLARFHARFEHADDPVAFGARLDQLATSNHIQLDVGNYQTSGATDVGLRRTDIRVTASGQYPALRALLTQLLRDVPNAALQTLSLSHEPQTNRISADVRLALFTRTRAAITDNVAITGESFDPVTARLRVDKFASRFISASTHDLFGLNSPPPAIIPPLTEEALPVAPVLELISPEPTPSSPALTPLEYRYLGRLSQSGRSDVYLLADATHVYTVAVGDTLGDHYRLTGATAEGLTLTYLPHNSEQQLAFGTP